MTDDTHTPPAPADPERTECRRGHPWTVANVYVHKDGSTSCRLCRRAAWKRWAAKQPKAEK